MRTGAETVIFWGAGATASLGMRLTPAQASAIRNLVHPDDSQPLVDRVTAALVRSGAWAKPLTDLLLILGDDTEKIHHISPNAHLAMGRHWSDTADESLTERIHVLRALYDWPALKAVVGACPGFVDGQRFHLQDVFNLMDLHAQSYNGFSVRGQFLSHQRLIAARRALQLVLNTLFFVDWQTALTNKVSALEQHLGFAQLLTEHHQQQGLALAAAGKSFDTRDFYLGDIAFVSLNYDPVALWAQFIANKEANDLNPPCIDVPRVPLKIFHDFGIFMAVSTIDPQNDRNKAKERVWYPLNEESAQRLNDRDHSSRRVRINKFLFPHGCLCWRECPSCGKLTAYMGKQWQFLSRALIPPPPLRGFAQQANLLDEIEPETDEEQRAWERGETDARACVHCDAMTYAHHTQAIMQSNFKQAPPSFIEEVQRDLRVVTQSANHIILMGYSLPPDDVAYRAFFAARKQVADKTSSTSTGKVVRCSVVVGTDFDDHWYNPTEITELLKSPDKMKTGESPRTTLEAARDIFGVDNVRFYGCGIPQVFCDGAKASSVRLQQLTNWRRD